MAADTAWHLPTGGAVPVGGVGREDTRGHPPSCASSALRWPAIIHAWVSRTSSPGDDRAITWGEWSGRYSAGGRWMEMSHSWHRATNRSWSVGWAAHRSPSSVVRHGCVGWKRQRAVRSLWRVDRWIKGFG